MKIAFIAIIVATSLLAFLPRHAASSSVLISDCTLISSAHTDDTGEQISQASYTPSPSSSPWFNVTLPCTVMACLLQNNVFPDNLFHGMNLENVDSTMFDQAWWYRCAFTAPPHNTSFLTAKGLNYKANVYIDGKSVGTLTDTVGTFRYFDFPLDNSGSGVGDSGSGGNHAIAFEIYRPYDRAVGPNASSDMDLAISFVDWAPYPPDMNMGLWRDLELTTLQGSVVPRYPVVNTTLDGSTAHLSVMFEASNFGNAPVTGIATVIIDGNITIKKEITVKAGEHLQVVFLPTDFPALIVQHAQLWWPWQMGASTMHTLSILFSSSGAMDRLDTTFGIRTVTSELDGAGHRLYRVNGKPILIRGAGWSPDLFLRASPSRQRAEFQYVRQLNLNAIRLEGKFDDDNFFDLADEFGILVLPGWCCCDAWQRWSKWTPAIATVAEDSLRDQLRRLRIHPSMLVFYYGSDELAPESIEKMFLQVFEEEAWPNCLLASASDLTSKVTGPTGVKMSGPYSWVPPVYWLEDTHRLGGAFGFLTEGGPGEAPMELQSLTNTLDSDSMWPMNKEWDWHTGNPHGIFHNLRFFTPPLYARYGEATSASEYLYKSQIALYEGHRAYFEGYTRNKYTSTGLIQWMLNNAWPSNIWHLYDYYLGVGGQFFGTRKACEELHAIYSYNDRSVWVVNSLYKPFHKVNVSVEVRDISGHMVWFSYDHLVDVLESDATHKVVVIPSLKNVTSTYFVRLKVTSTNSSEPAINDYWLSTRDDVLDWALSTFYTTLCSQYANLTLLNTLPPISQLVLSPTRLASGFIVSITNPTSVIAFGVRVHATRVDNKQEVLPALWSDNYILLLPGERRVLRVTFPQLSPSELDNVELSYEVYNNVVGK